MSVHKIFVLECNVDRLKVGRSRSTDYSYNPESEELTIYWCGEEVIRREGVRPGDAFIVTCYGSTPKLEPMHFPRNPSDMLLYILGFANGLRHHSAEHYVKCYNAERQQKVKRGFVEREFTGAKYRLNVCVDPFGKVYHLAGLIYGKLEQADYAEILMRWPFRINYPRVFLERVFREQFNMSDAAIQKYFAKKF